MGVLFSMPVVLCGELDPTKHESRSLEKHQEMTNVILESPLLDGRVLCSTWVSKLQVWREGPSTSRTSLSVCLQEKDNPTRFVSRLVRKLNFVPLGTSPESYLIGTSSWHWETQRSVD